MKNKNTNVTITEAVVIEVKQLGRKVNPESARQKRIAELELKRQKGELKKGRPIVEDSARQKRIAELAAKKANGELRKGRPINTESKRQQRIAELNAKAEMNGGVIPKGRPKQIKIEVVESSSSENEE